MEKKKKEMSTSAPNPAWQQVAEKVGGQGIGAWEKVSMFRAESRLIVLAVVAVLFIFVAMTGVLKGIKKPKDDSSTTPPQQNSFAVTPSQTPKQCFEACVHKTCPNGPCFADVVNKCRVDCKYPSGY